MVAAAMVLLVAMAGAIPVAGAEQVRADQWYLDFLDIQEAHQLSRGEGITVAVVDSGVNADHRDLSRNVLPGVDFVGSGDGRTDGDGHGTGVASLIAGHGRGLGAGVMGIAPRAKILPVRVTGSVGLAYPATVARGIRWAVDRGAQTINVSWGRSVTHSDLQEAIHYAIERDRIVVAAAGNPHQGDHSIIYPARYEGVLATSAVDRSGQFATDYSVQGSRVTLAAPGVEIVSADPGGKYAIGTGTSGAAAILSGVVALVWSQYPELGAADVINRLLRTADDRGPEGRDPRYGFGIVDPVEALTADVPPVQLDESPTAASTSSGGAARTGDRGGGTALVAGIIAAGIAVVALAVVIVVLLTRRRGSPSSPGP